MIKWLVGLAKRFFSSSNIVVYQASIPTDTVGPTIVYGMGGR